MISKRILIIVIILGVLVSSGAFVAGMAVQKGRTRSVISDRFENAAANGFGQRDGQMGRMRDLGKTTMGKGMAIGERPVVGEIISKDEKTLTVKLTDGSSKIVVFSNDTSITKDIDATKQDLKVGETVRIFGTTNSDGSVTGTNIKINPEQLKLNQNQ